MSEREEKIRKLKEYFARRDEVQMAFLFGSQAEGRAGSRSDWDIGVYLSEENREKEREIWREVEEILKSEVDFIVLNRAPATLGWRIVGQGQELMIRDRKRYLDFLLRVSEEADAFYRTSEEYYDIFQRSTSLVPGDRERLRRIVEFLEEEIKDYEKFRQLSWDGYRGDKEKKRGVEHWVEHLVNAVVDVAKVVLASERRPQPETYQDIVMLLDTVPPFSDGGIGKKIAEWVRLRNILAHEYLDYRWKEISAFIQETEPLWHLFVERTKKFLEAG